MTGIKDILINARQESYRMQHHYIGVEHLFIGMLEIQQGVTSTLLEERGLTTKYLIDAIRRKVGKGNRQRLWAGMPNTPRADVILSIANDLALEDQRTDIIERDLLLAILDENDSIPVRVLRRLNVDTTQLAADIQARPRDASTSQPYIRVDFGEAFDAANPVSEDELFIMRRMFYGYGEIRIERRLTGGYSNASLYVVTPIGTDGMNDSPVVVKIDDADIILDEAARYDTHVKASLPPLTARLEDKPTTSETSHLAGLKYTFVTARDGASRDLRDAASDLGADLGDWLKQELYPQFGKTWWMQSRPFRFPVWTEYDWLLPPLLTLEYIPEDEVDPSALIIRDPVKRSRLRDLDYGAPVIIEGFLVQRLYRTRNAIQLSVGKGSEAARRAYKIEVRTVDFSSNVFYRSEVVERVAGRVWETRDAALLNYVNTLDPDFDPHSRSIPGADAESRLLNPLVYYDGLLDHVVNGSLSKIHGDLHLGNILLGLNRTPFLIDFAQTRSGHTLFDWACLELSLLTDVIMPEMRPDWEGVRFVLGALLQINRGGTINDELLNELLRPIRAVREIVAERLTAEGKWSEYYIALALCALRAVTWETLSVACRRLMFYVSAMAMSELYSRRTTDGSVDTLTSDDASATDYSNTDL